MSEERAQYHAGDPTEEPVEIVRRISFGDGEILVKVTGSEAREAYYRFIFNALMYADRHNGQHDE